MNEKLSDLQDILNLISNLSKREPILVNVKDDASDFKAEMAWLRNALNQENPSIQMPRIAIFAAHHGFARGDIPEQEKIISNIMTGNHSLCRMAKSLDCDLRLYELDLENPTKDISTGENAMNSEECSMAISYGMMSVEEANDFLIIDTLGAGSQSAAEKIINVIEGDIEPFDLLMKYGGYEIAALCGFILAAYLGKKPVLISSLSGLAATLIMHKLNPLLSSHIACLGLETSFQIQKLEEPSTSNSLCGTAGFKLAQLKTLLSLQTDQISLDQKQA